MKNFAATIKTQWQWQKPPPWPPAPSFPHSPFSTKQPLMLNAIMLNQITSFINASNDLLLLLEYTRVQSLLCAAL